MQWRKESHAGAWGRWERVGCSFKFSQGFSLTADVWVDLRAVSESARVYLVGESSRQKEGQRQDHDMGQYLGTLGNRKGSQYDWEGGNKKSSGRWDQRRNRGHAEPCRPL